MLSNHESFVSSVPNSTAMIPAGRLSEPLKSPWFTGWKDCSHTRLDTAGKQYIAQWVEYVSGADGPQCLYVNLPGMESGKIPIGGCIEFTGMALDRDTPESECHRIIEEGYHKLMELVAAEKAKAA